MKKIIPSFLTILLIVGIVASSAYALFSSTATVSGLTFSTGNADLQISTDGVNWDNSLNSTSDYTNMSSGFSSSQEFYLKNSSLSNITLGVFVKLLDNAPSENSTAWGIIGDKISITFQKYGGGNWTDLNTGTLIQWKETGFDLDSLSLDSSQKYRMLVVLGDVDDNESDQGLTNLSFQLIGTQQ